MLLRIGIENSLAAKLDAVEVCIAVARPTLTESYAFQNSAVDLPLSGSDLSSQLFPVVLC